MKVFDENDNEVPPGTIGELVMRSPSVMLGYYKEPKKTAEVFRNGWLHTGDLGIMDEEGYFYFVDRKKDIVKTGAENVSTVEVEGVIFRHPKVAEATVVGLPHAKWVEAVTAFVVPKPNQTLTEEEIIQYCKENLAGYKVPKKVIILDTLPKNPSGKILKKVLRKEFQGAYEGEKA
jgi:fatty-acyl-CoA synthase